MFLLKVAASPTNVLLPADISQPDSKVQVRGTRLVWGDHRPRTANAARNPSAPCGHKMEKWPRDGKRRASGQQEAQEADLAGFTLDDAAIRGAEGEEEVVEVRLLSRPQSWRGTLAICHHVPTHLHQGQDIAYRTSENGAHVVCLLTPGERL